MELAVGRVGEDADRCFLRLHQHRDCGRHHVGRIRPDQEIDFIDIDEFGVDLRNIRRVALIVVEHELDRASEQAALGVDVVAPDFDAEQRSLAAAGEPAGLRHAHPDFDRWLLSACSRGQPERGDGNGSAKKRPSFH
jgi:hypothetical protein